MSMHSIHYNLQQVSRIRPCSHTITAHPSVTSQDIPFLYKQQRKSTAVSVFEDSLLHFSVHFKATLQMANALHGLKRNNQILNTDIYLQMFCWKVQLSAVLKMWSNNHWNQWVCWHFNTAGRTGSCIGDEVQHFSRCFIISSLFLSP